ncbi:hypothetical protein SDC9_189737 [bioreactor metagenome]|uniref:Uncharacterized protein n=1 Tax=bioreactor metagenome TaxID=1076179 RepID=A0A645HT11_9ZZZZ
MGDEQDALALPGKAPHHFHQLVDFLRGQYRRRLIKDQYLVIPVQHLEDLHTLLHAHRNILDLRVRIHFQAIALAELHHPFAGFILLQHAPARLLSPQNDIIQHRKNLHQLEMLMDHADAQGIGIIGA